MITYAEFENNTREIEVRIAEVCAQCGRDPSEIKLMAVTKSHPYSAVEYAKRYGLQVIGENRVQEAIEKMEIKKPDIHWELIGHLQSNKAKVAAAHFDRIQSIDRMKVLTALDKYSAELNKTLPVLLQINAGEDPAKHGANPDEAPALLESALQCKNIKVEGLMTIAPLDKNTDVATACFERLHILRDSLSSQFKIKLSELSMGMTGDMIQAIKAGSTLLRIGTALFGERK